MNINNFKEYVDKTILKRGYDYYTDGNIVDTYNEGDNTYTFEVQGSEDYKVVVQLDDNGEIIYSECDCPYDFGPICKHEVAAYFELAEYISDEINNKAEITRNVIIDDKAKKIKEPEIKEVLNNLSKEKLIDIILDITQKDKTLKDSLIVRYSKGNREQELKKCKKLIGSIVRKHLGREGFISYREAGYFVSDMEELIEKIRETDDIILALDIAFLVIDEGIEAFQYTDDSDGDVGYLVSETIDLISEIISYNEDIDSKIEEIFERLLSKSESKIFDGWTDYRMDMLGLCAEAATTEVLRDKLKIRLNYLIDKNSNNENMKYSNENMLHILFNMVNKYGTKEEAEQFIKDNLKFSSFRELFKKKYLEEKNYKKVIELALEGEEQDKRFAGLISKWKQVRYLAYKGLSMKDEQRNLAKEFLFQGNFEYYKELEELAEDKINFYNDLKQELKANEYWQAKSIFLQIILEEKDLDEIMGYVRDNPTSIDSYAEILIDEFKDEVIDIYKKYIKFEASRARNRSHYKNVCGIIKKYKKIAGKQSQIPIINELIALHRKKPAFLDELSRIE
ncbi:SWIM zinc finger family protein [Clostridium chromiireducens]|uniref:SWIM zinc finger family protein n=1 Tax=Clostridium chromiireducens TaxID=225345 RepID=UPI003AF81453